VSKIWFYFKTTFIFKTSENQTTNLKNWTIGTSMHEELLRTHSCLSHPGNTTRPQVEWDFQSQRQSLVRSESSGSSNASSFFRLILSKSKTECSVRHQTGDYFLPHNSFLLCLWLRITRTVGSTENTGLKALVHWWPEIE